MEEWVNVIPSYCIERIIEKAHAEGTKHGKRDVTLKFLQNSGVYWKGLPLSFILLIVEVCEGVLKPSALNANTA